MGRHAPALRVYKPERGASAHFLTVSDLGDPALTITQIGESGKEIDRIVVTKAVKV